MEQRTCSKCGWTVFDYDKYFQQYTCSRCGWISEQQFPNPKDAKTETARGQEEKSEKKKAIGQKIVSTCAFIGAAIFFVLNMTTGVVPGGFLGGAIGGALGAVIGMAINWLRRK